MSVSLVAGGLDSVVTKAPKGEQIIGASPKPNNVN
jgi:hypothetical protein